MFAGACSDDGGRATAGLSAGVSAGGVTSLTGAGASTTEGPEETPTGSGGGSTGAGASTSAGGEEATSTGAAAATSTGEAVTGGAASTGGAPKFDLGDEPPGGMPSDREPCVKVDLLFVVDDSSSMKQEQANLIASFPAFVQEIQKELADAESLHIGVVTTDEYEFNEPPCDHVLGGLVTQTGGAGASNMKCGPYAGGGRYMSEQDDLPQRFACAGQVGTDGDGDEKPVDAALYALGAGLNAPGACNDGFARDDALLVLVLITDEEEEGSVGDPPQWFNSLVALRGGLETNIVVLSLIGPEQPPCADAAEIGHRLIEFTGMFTYGSVGQICAANYQQFFHDAITGIAEACEQFIPPG